MVVAVLDGCLDKSARRVDIGQGVLGRIKVLGQGSSVACISEVTSNGPRIA